MAIIKKTTTKGTNSTQTLTVPLVKLKSITSVTTNTGKATYELSGENIIVTLTGGTYVDYQTTGSYKAPSSKTVTEYYNLSGSTPSTMSYSKDGYSGTLQRASGLDSVQSYDITPADSKTYTTTEEMSMTASVPSTKEYSSGGYTGTLSKTGEKTEDVVDEPAQTMDMRVTHNYQFGETGVGSQITYDKDGYVGNLTRGDWYYYIMGDTKKYDGPTYEGSIKSIANGKTITKYVEFTGKVTKPATYKKVKKVTYSGTITKPAVTGTAYLYAYTGTVTDPGYDTRSTTYYYQYDVTIDYIQKGAPVGTPIPKQSLKLNDTKNYNLASYFTDPDGDPMTYKVTSSNPAVATATLSGATLTVRTLKLGTSIVTITATDADGNETPIEFTVEISNTPPVIQLSSLKPSGKYTDKPSFNFIVTDADGDDMRVRMLLDNTVISDKQNVSTNSALTYSLTEEQWLKCPIGKTITLTVEATDTSGEKTSLSSTITRVVNKIDVQLKTPVMSSMRPQNVFVKLVGNIPETADISVMVSNNAYDASPKWEDITSMVKLGVNAPFQNETKTATSWAVSYRIIIQPRTAGELVYLDGVTTSFD